MRCAAGPNHHPWNGGQAIHGRATFAQQEYRDGCMMGHSLRDTAQNPAFHASVAMTAQHNEVNVMCLHGREDGSIARLDSA